MAGKAMLEKIRESIEERELRLEFPNLVATQFPIVKRIAEYVVTTYNWIKKYWPLAKFMLAPYEYIVNYALSIRRVQKLLKRVDVFLCKCVESLKTRRSPIRIRFTEMKPEVSVPATWMMLPVRSNRQHGKATEEPKPYLEDKPTKRSLEVMLEEPTKSSETTSAEEPLKKTTEESLQQPKSSPTTEEPQR